MLMNNAFLSARDPPLSALRAIWRDHQELLASAKPQTDIRLGIAASFTVHNLVPFLGAGLLDAGFVPDVRLAPYDQIFQACLEPDRHLGTMCNLAILLWRIEDHMLDELAAFARDGSAALQKAMGKLDQLLEAAASLRAHFAGTIILGVPPFPTHGPEHFSGLAPERSPAAFHGALASRMREKTASGIVLLDLAAVQADFGVSASLDWRQWYLYRQPFREEFLRAVAQSIARLVKAAHRPPKKCILLDADNTLWGGIVGEDGLSGIALGRDFPGSAYRDFQRQLLHLRSRGILLAVVSKNNEQDVLEVFDRHPDMLLKREHISAWSIQWGTKAEAVPAIAAKLNIGTDSLVFIDDNPMEIAQMREAWPEVTCLQLPEEPADILSTIQHLSWFDSLALTQEDRARAEMMEAEKNRESLMRLSPQEFRRALGLAIAFAPARSEELGRIAQLINKTNQFNLTTIRRSLGEVTSLSRSPVHGIYALKVSDKFGDYGLTGVVVVDKTDKLDWAIDTLLLSCRVLGRGVESALLSALAEEARLAGARSVSARFLPTAKNAPASRYLPSHGFHPVEGGNWRIAIADIAAMDPCVKRF